LLLDTHLLVWSAYDARRLPAAARRLIEDRAETVAFSFASLWEVAVKSSLGRRSFSMDVQELHAQLLLHDFQPLPVRLQDIAVLASLPWHHRDPFDRMLVAQAVVEKTSLLTADRALAAYGPFVKVV
jgi:PIN domain nuclease of toxin-antitoxin system